MLKNKLTQYHSSPDSVVVARILGQVHKAIDENFPNSRPEKKKRFAQTEHTAVEENTAISRIPPYDGVTGEQDPAFLENENLSFSCSSDDKETQTELSPSEPSSTQSDRDPDEITEDDAKEDESLENSSDQFNSEESSWNGGKSPMTRRLSLIGLALLVLVGIAYVFLVP